MTLQIKPSTLEEVDKICEMLEICYDYPAPALERFRNHYPSFISEYYSLIDDEKHVGDVRIIPLAQNLRGVFKSVGCVSNVTSAPETRRKGHINELMLHVFQQMFEQGIVCTTLYPFQDAFYADYGYIKAPPVPKIEFNPKLLHKWNTLPEGYRFERIRPKDGLEIYKKVQEGAIEDIHGSIQRTEKRWDEVVASNKGWLIAILNPKNEPEAMMIHKVSGYGDRIFGDDQIGTMNTSNMYWTTSNGRAGLLHYIYLMSDQVARVYIPVIPGKTHYYAWLSGYTKVKVSYNLITMFRIIDVEKCLQGIPVNGEGVITINVTDPECPWNEQPFDFSVSEEGKLQVSTSRRKVRPLSITIQGLSALLYGTLPVSELIDFGWISEADPIDLEILQRWFPRIDPYMIEDF